MRQEHGPCRLKVGACLVEGGGGAALVFARMRARIEAAIPLPRISIVRVAAADRDGPHAHVTVKDVPAFFAGIGGASAGECRHALSKRDLGGESKPGGAEKPVASFRVGRSSPGRPYRRARNGLRRQISLRRYVLWRLEGDSLPTRSRPRRSVRRQSRRHDRTFAALDRSDSGPCIRLDRKNLKNSHLDPAAG